MRSLKCLLFLTIAGLWIGCSAAQPLNRVQETAPAFQASPLEARLDQLGRSISASLVQQKRARIAVIEFTDLNGSVSDLGKFLAEELTTRLVTAGSFQVIERRLIEKILKEQQLGMTGIVDEKTAMKVGSLLGADFLATGTTADLGTGIKVNARIISVEKGSVFSVASIMIPKSDQVKMLLGKSSERIAETTAAPSGQKEQDISGTWKFICCSGKYWGEIDLAQSDGNKIKGSFYDMANKSGGTVDGTISGKKVLFTRNKGEQDYKLTLSADGKSMSGFFVGIHDGSADTEVLMIRDKNLSADGSVTPEGPTSWREAADFGREMDRYWKDGLYPAKVEGRNADGRSQFRAFLQPFPKRVWWFYWWYGQQESAYEEHRQKMTADGFKEIHVQVFVDQDGVRRFQTCWIKFGS